MSKRAAIYARVSTDDQRDNYSIPTQIDACLRYVERQGYALVGDHFVDPDTGRDTVAAQSTAIRAYVDDYTSLELSRPALNAAMQFMQTVGFDVLVVHAIDRLARDSYIRQTLERDLEAAGAKVEYVLGNYEDTPEGEVRKDLDATFAKWENAKRVERCNRGKRRKAETGLFVAGRAPLGYVIDRDAPGGLAVDESSAETVREIFRMYVIEGRSIREIRTALTERGESTALGNDSWAKSSIRRILGNTVYVGCAFYNKHKRNGGRLELRDREEWIKFETTPIVEQWLFDEAKRKLAENRKVSRRQPKRFYLLGSMVVCGICGRPYLSQTAKAGKNRRKHEAQSYRHRKSQGHCCNHQVSARRLEPIVWEEISGLLLDPAKLRIGYQASLAEHEKAKARQRAILTKQRKTAGTLEQKLRNLTDAYIDPDIGMTKNEYVEQREQIERQLLAAKEAIQHSERELAETPHPVDIETMESFAARVRRVMGDDNKLTPEKQRKVLEMLHVKVVMKPDRDFKIEGWFGPPIDGLSYTTSARCERRPTPPPAPA